jgi:hypothetical protein
MDGAVRVMIFQGGMKNGQTMQTAGVIVDGETRFPNAHRVSDKLLQYEYSHTGDDEQGRMIFSLVSCAKREDRWVGK